MKNVLLLFAAVAIVAPVHAALEPGDLVVLGSLVQPEPTPAVPALFNVKPDGTIETLSTDDVLGGGGYNIGPVVCPDGSIIVAKVGNWIGDATPTPRPTPTSYPTGYPTYTPMPTNYWRQSGVYRISPDGTVSTVAEGGGLNPEYTGSWGGSLEGIACDSQGNIFVSHQNYAFPTPTPRCDALLKIENGSGTPEPFASFSDNTWPWGGDVIVNAADDVFVPQSTYNAYASGGYTPTPMPAKISKVNATDGDISTLVSAATIETYTSPYGYKYFWSEPFSELNLIGFDFIGNLIMEGWFEREPYGAGWGDNIFSISADGRLTTLLDVSGSHVDLLGANGEYLGFDANSIYTLNAGTFEEEYIVHGDRTHDFGSMAYYPPEKPQLSVNVSEEVFGPSDSIAFGFGLTRGRTANEADIYFAIQFPASEGGDIKLINPNASVNGLPLLIDLSLAEKYPTQIGILRYGNGTTAVKGSGTMELLKFSNIVIPDGTYTLLGVMTAPGANLFDTSGWLTPNKQPVSADTTYSKALL